jgi:hypothetical protein
MIDRPEGNHDLELTSPPYGTGRPVESSIPKITLTSIPSDNARRPRPSAAVTGSVLGPTYILKVAKEIRNSELLRNRSHISEPGSRKPTGSPVSAMRWSRKSIALPKWSKVNSTDGANRARLPCGPLFIAQDANTIVELITVTKRTKFRFRLSNGSGFSRWRFLPVGCNPCSMKGMSRANFNTGSWPRILSWTACPFSVGSCLCPQVSDSFSLFTFPVAAVVPLGVAVTSASECCRW